MNLYPVRRLNQLQHGFVLFSAIQSTCVQEIKRTTVPNVNVKTFDQLDKT